MELKEIEEMLVSFRDKRRWKKYHKPKDLAVSIAIEVGELLELFQWKSDEEIENLLEDEDFKEKIGEEISDVVIYAILLAHECRINLDSALLRKMEVNERKYPV